MFFGNIFFVKFLFGEKSFVVKQVFLVTTVTTITTVTTVISVTTVTTVTTVTLVSKLVGFR